MIVRPVLAFDCSGAACSVAVATMHEGGGDFTVLAHREQAMSRGHAAALAPMIESALAAAGVRPPDLGLVAATVGPGSFTGVRIGLATARGLALALSIPLAGLTTIETLLAGATDGDRIRLRAERRRLVAAIDTHRGDYYAGFEDPAPPFVADAAGMAGCAADGPLMVIGDGAAALCAALLQAGHDATAAEGPTLPDAAVVARLAMRRDAEHWAGINRSDGMPRPLYLRAAAVTAPKSA